MEKRIYNDPKWRKTLLKTPSGFALFEINEVAFKEPDDIWVYFRNVTVAKKILFVLGFVKFDEMRSAWDGETRPSKDLMGLIQNFCDDKNHLFVETAELEAIITDKLNVKCSYDPNVADEVAWGLKNVLHEVIPQEKDNITRDYCLPLSKGLERFIQDNLINVSATMLTADLISEMGLAQYLNITLKEVPKILRGSFDKHVCKIGDSIENDLKYARVLSRILVPELAPKYDLSKIVSHDIAPKIQEAQKVAAQYRKEKLTMRNRETIIESLAHLLAVPKQRDEVMTQVKLMEAKLRIAELGMLGDTDDRSMSELGLEPPLKFRRTLLETPSGFAIFDVHEKVFNCPHIWSWFTEEMEARAVVLALGFVKVRDKSIARNSCDGPGEELSRLIQKLCADKKNLIVQNDDLKSIIEKKLEVKCHTKSSTGDNSLDDLFWGLKHVLHEFVPQEKDNLTVDYYLPLSQGLQDALRLYGVALPGKMNRDFVSIFGYLAHLELTTASVRKIFRKSFNYRISQIGELIKDDLVYAQVTAKILIPEVQHEFDCLKLLSSDLVQKVADLAKIQAESGEAISADDKEIIRSVIAYLTDVPKKRYYYLKFLNGGCSEEDLQRIEQECIMAPHDDVIGDWIVSMTPLMVEDQVDVEEAKKGTGKMAVQNVEKTALEVEAMSKNKSSEDKSVRGDEFGPSCRGNQQIAEGPGTSLVDDDSPDMYLNTIYEEEIPNNETESNQQSKPMLDESFDKSCNIEEFVESSAEKSVSADDDSIKHGRDGCYLEASDNVKTQNQPESTSETADLVMPKEADNVDGQHYSNAVGGIKAILNAVGPDVGAKVVFVDGAAVGPDVGAKVVLVDGAANTTESVCSSGAAMDDSIKKSQVDIVELSTSATEHEIITAGGTNDVDKKMQNEKGGTDDLTFRESFDKYQKNKEMADAVSVKDNCSKCEQNEEIMAKMQQIIDMLQGIQKVMLQGKAETTEQNAGTASGSPSDETKVVQDTNAVIEGQTEDTTSEEISTEDTNGADHNEWTAIHSTDNADDRAYEQTTTDAASHKLSLVTSTSCIQKRRDEETSADATSDKTNAAHTTYDIAEHKNGERIVDPTLGISTERSIGDFEEEKQSEATKEDSNSGEINTLQGFCYTEKEQNAEITTGLGSDETKVARNTNVVIKGRTEDKISEEISTIKGTEDAKEADHNEGTAVHGTDGAYEQSMTDTASHKLSLVTSTSSIQKWKDEETSEDATSDKTNAAHSTDNIVEQKNGERIVDPTPGVSAERSVGDFEDKKQSEATTEDSSSGEIDTLQGTDDREKEQNAETTTGLASDETEVAQNTNVVVKGRTEDTISEEISTIKSTQDAKGADHNEGTIIHGTDNADDRAYEQTMTDSASHKLSLVTSTSSIQKWKAEETSVDPTSDKTNAAHTTYDIVEQKNGECIVVPTLGVSTECGIDDFEDKKQSEATTEDSSSGEIVSLQGTGNTDKKEQNGDATTCPSSDETNVAQNTNDDVEARTKDTIPEISTVKSTEDAKEADHNEETAVRGTDKAYEQTMTDTASLKLSMVTSTSSIQKWKDEETSLDATSDKTNAAHSTYDIFERKNGERIVVPILGVSTECGIDDFGDKKQSEATTEGSSSGEIDSLQGTGDTDKKEQNGDATTCPSSDETNVAQNTNDDVEARTKDTIPEISTVKSTEDANGVHQSETNVAQNTNDDVEARTKDTIPEISTVKSTEDANGANQSEATTEEPGESNMLEGTYDAKKKEQNAEATKSPASDENQAFTASGRVHSTLRDLFNSDYKESIVKSDDENTGSSKGSFDSKNKTSIVNQHGNDTGETEEIFNSEDLKSTENGSNESTDTTKEKKARVKNCLRLFRSQSSKDKASQSPEDTMSPVQHSCGCMWRRRRIG